MRKLMIFALGAALVLAMTGSAMALDLNADIKLSVGGTNFSAISIGDLQQQASADVFGLDKIITKNDGKVISKVDLPNVDIDQWGVVLGTVNVDLGAQAGLIQITDVEAACTDFALSKNEGFVLAKVEVGEGGVYVNNINPLGLYPYDPWNGQQEFFNNPPW
ncbi:MAG: hypothetical protein KQI62_01970 [Deltaproteobacteria bacterium]|nr:hypothetical protein [Deltaproteobacteria bacterium]